MKQTRLSKKHRFQMRMDESDFAKVRVIAFNASISINRTIEMLLTAALEDDLIIDRIYAAHPPKKDQFIYICDREGG